MRFRLTASLLEALRARAQVEVDSFLLDPGLGPARFLTADGRVLIDGTDWDGTPLREATDDEAIVSLVVGAKKTGLDELLALIPPPPAGASVCARCGGTRWMTVAAVITIVCSECSGRGWLDAARS